MTALFINLKIDKQEKYELFKLTIADISDLFEESHVKIRGIFANECKDYIQNKLEGKINYYQELSETDWIVTSLEMLKQIKSRSVFIYVEDHRLVSLSQQLKKTLTEFDQYKLDYLCYSFFKSSKLGVENILPFGGMQRKSFDEFELNNKNISIIGKISPIYYTFSYTSLCSTKYFRALLVKENKCFKIYNRLINKIFKQLFRYPYYRAVFHRINNFFSLFSVKFCQFEPSSPFNLEKIWFETTPLLANDTSWKYGVLKQELYANYDDDNGSYGESLIKKGLYPLSFNCSILSTDRAVSNKIINRIVELRSGERFSLFYYSTKSRIYTPPIIYIKVKTGMVVLKQNNRQLCMREGDTKSIFSNKNAVLEAIKTAVIELKIFDEVF
jgi:hypothetical protein